MDTHRFKDPDFGMRMEFINSSIGFTKMGQVSSLVSYGFNGLNKSMMEKSDTKEPIPIS